MGKGHCGSSLAVRRISLRNILVTLCFLVSLLLLVALQAVYTGTLPSVVAKWAGPPPNGVSHLRDPFHRLPGFGVKRPSHAQDVLTNIPVGSQLGVPKGFNSDDNNYKCVALELG